MATRGTIQYQPGAATGAARGGDVDTNEGLFISESELPVRRPQAGIAAIIRLMPFTPGSDIHSARRRVRLLCHARWRAVPDHLITK